MSVFIPKTKANFAKARKSKYGNKRVEYMRIMFDSIGERDRYIFLKDCERRGEIRNLRTQVSFELEVNDQLICRYIADFSYEHSFDSCLGKVLPKGTIIEEMLNAWVPVVEDFKGMTTPIFKLKAKLMRAIHGIDVKVVKSPTAVIG